MSAPTLAPLLEDRRILVCVGSGGVGKTTTAATLGLGAARAGRRTLVLTIDPAKRLANALGLSGLRYIPEMKRFYLNGSLAAHVLGFVDIDENGLSGLERFYDQSIRGENGRLILNRDAFNKYYDHELKESVPGANLHLTIDSAIQLYAEKFLAEGVSKSQAKGGTIVMMKPPP